MKAGNAMKPLPVIKMKYMMIKLDMMIMTYASNYDIVNMIFRDKFDFERFGPAGVLQCRLLHQPSEHPLLLYWGRNSPSLE